MGASGSDQAIAAILKWSGREGWREPFDAAIAAHRAPTCENVGGRRTSCQSCLATIPTS